MSEIVMPRLSDSMEEGTVVQWLKSIGEEIAVGDELVEIETDKATMVYEADVAGTLAEIVAPEGETLPVGGVIARVGGEPGDSSSQSAPESAPVPDSPPPADPGPAPVAAPSGSPSPSDGVATGASPAAATALAPAAAGRVKASPVARRIAASHGIGLHTLVGSGPVGRITKADVEAALASSSAPSAGAPASSPAQAGVASPPPLDSPPASESNAAPAGPGGSVETAKGAVEVVELTKLQQTVARRMSESKATAPHFYLQAEIDMTAAVAGRRALKEAEAAPGREAEEAASGAVPTYNDMVVKACALALREFPRANGAYRDGKIEHYSRINVGVAVAGQDTLVVPTVFDADLKGLRQISTETKALAARVRDGSITPPELSGGTFTVSNLGMYGISNFHAVINTPQAGILAVGELKPKPAVAENEEIVARQLMGVTLACDHRILYGAGGAQFLARVRALLEEPIGLAL